MYVIVSAIVELRFLVDFYLLETIYKNKKLTDLIHISITASNL